MTLATFGVALLLSSVPILALIGIAAIRGGKKLIQRALLHLLCYAIDAGMAVIGFTLGFGLEIKSWAWLLLAMVVGRFAFYTLNSAYFADEARKPYAPAK